MTAVKLIHLICVATWGGVVVAESFLENAGRDLATRQMVARVHAWIDLWVEVPLLATVLSTGAWMTWTIWPLGPWHLIKVACGLTAVAANLACVVFVLRRQRVHADEGALRRWDRRVYASALGMPFGLGAAALGLLGWP